MSVETAWAATAMAGEVANTKPAQRPATGPQIETPVHQTAAVANTSAATR